MNNKQIEAAIAQLVEAENRPAEIKKNVAGYGILIWWMLGEQGKWNPMVQVSKNGELVLSKGWGEVWDSDDVKLIPASPMQKIDAYLQSQAPAVNAATQSKAGTSNGFTIFSSYASGNEDMFATGEIEHVQAGSADEAFNKSQLVKQQYGDTTAAKFAKEWGRREDGDGSVHFETDDPFFIVVPGNVEMQDFEKYFDGEGVDW